MDAPVRIDKSHRMDRLIPLEGVRNFRDFGGWPAAERRRVRRGRLYRSGHFAQATEEDWGAIRALDLHTVADLRRASERQRDPSAWPEGWGVTVLASDSEDMSEAPHITFLKESEITEDSTRGYMMGSYRRIPFGTGHQALFRQFFGAAAHGEGAVLAHCAAGKDRTGILCALTLAVLDTPREAIIEDYLMTNEAVGLDEVLPVIAERINSALGRDATAAALKPMVGVEADYIDAAFKEIERRSGSLEVYLETVLGLDAAQRARLQAALLED